MKNSFISSNHVLKKAAILFVTFAMIFQCLFSAQAVKAEETDIQFNGAGLKTNVSGFIGTTADGSYIVEDKLVFNIVEPKNKQFNKFSINYTASDVVKGTISYKTADTIYTEDFYLEKGDEADFTSLIDNTITVDTKVISNVIGLKPLQLTFEPIKEGTRIAFKLHSFETAMGYRPVNDTVYIENERFKLGVYMAWGGGVNYIEDKLDGDDTVTNMLNAYDTGRLVQQSYYGTMKEPYVLGNYQGSSWGYNPVQGGDQFNNKSKILDFTIEENYIYVKCRPLDWSQYNTPTYAYMENTYTLHDDYIEVDNRFVDFSTYDHGESGRHQELPAFYTISYLDTFTFYNGKKPWTDDELTVKKDLPFWGERDTADDCYTTLDKSNTETWCAWTSSEKGYGIGLYTPQVEIMLAGRCEYDGSKDPKAFPTNYVAPLITNTMRNFEPFEYSYIISTGDVSTMRETFKEHKDDFNWKKTIDYTHINFDTTNDLRAFTRLDNCMIEFAEKGIAKITTVGEESNLEGELVIKTSLNSERILTTDYSYLTYTYMVPKSNSKDSYTTRMYFYIGKIVEALKEYSIPIELKCDGEYHTEIINLNDYKDIWRTTGGTTNCTLNSMRFDYFEESSAKDKIYISCIALSPDEETAKKYGDDAVKTDPATFDPDMMSYTPAAEADTVPQADITDPDAPVTTTPAPVSTDTEEKSTNWGKILIFAGIGALAVAVIVAVIIVVSLKKIKKKEAEENTDGDKSEDTSSQEEPEN